MFFIQKGRGFRPTLNHTAIRANITEFLSIMLVSIHSLAADNLKNTHTENSVCGCKGNTIFRNTQEKS